MKHSYIQLHVAILLAACSSIFGKLISLDAVFITFYRMLLAAVILFVVVISTRRTSGIGKSARGNILTGVLLALHWIMFYASIKFANVSIGVVCFCLSGFFTALVSPIINRQKNATSHRPSCHLQHRILHSIPMNTYVGVDRGIDGKKQ